MGGVQIKRLHQGKYGMDEMKEDEEYHPRGKEWKKNKEELTLRE